MVGRWHSNRGMAVYYLRVRSGELSRFLRCRIGRRSARKSAAAPGTVVEIPSKKLSMATVRESALLSGKLPLAPAAALVQLE